MSGGTELAGWKHRRVQGGDGSAIRGEALREVDARSQHVWRRSAHKQPASSRHGPARVIPTELPNIV
eukprot:9174735-Pyramimonas_sp.AAC.1